MSTDAFSNITIWGRAYRVADEPGSRTVRIVEMELARDAYRLSTVELQCGDVVVDVGGHVGLFAIYAATRWPGVIVHSFEPFEANADRFDRNIAASGLDNIHLHRYAITGDGKMITLAAHPMNSGAATSFSVSQLHLRKENIPSKTMDEAFEECGIHDCALLKMDCEGAEYEILDSARVLPRVRRLRAEFHSNQTLASRGGDPNELAGRIRRSYPDLDFHYTTIALAR